MKTITTMIFALALIQSASAQTIVNEGPGIAGNGITGTSPAYNISITSVDRFDGDKNPNVYININGKGWLVNPPSIYSSAFCEVMKWDAVQNKNVPFGFIKVFSPDGTQFLAGTVFIRTKPTIKVVSFKLIGFNTPVVMPTYQLGLATVHIYVFSNFTNTFVPAPWLNYTTRFTEGWVWLNNDYSFHSAIYDTYNWTQTPALAQLTIIPSPSGPIPPIMPARMK